MRILYKTEATGLDDSFTDDEGLHGLVHDYPFVEPAVLLGRRTLKNRPADLAKHRRWPSYECIARLREEFSLCVHVSGPVLLRRLLFEEYSRDALGLDLEGLPAVQLNLKLGSFLQDSCKFVDMVDEIEGRIDEVGGRLGQLPVDEVVIQLHTYAVGPSKRARVQRALELAPRLGSAIEAANGTRASFLMDPSGGSGQFAPETWPAPLPGHACGYVGGLTPDNVEEAIERVYELHEGIEAPRSWVGSESGLRGADGVFSVVQARRFLANCAPHVLEPAPEA